MFGDKKEEHASDFAPHPATVVGNFQLTTQLPNGRNIVISAYLLEGEDVSSLNNRLDVYQDVMERQRVRAEVPVLEHARDMIVQQMRDLEANMKGQQEALDKLKDRSLKGAKLTSQERMHMNTLQTNLGNAQTSVEANNKRLADAEKSITEAKQKAGLEKAA